MSQVYEEFNTFLGNIREVESRKRVDPYRNIIKKYWNEIYPAYELPIKSPVDDIRTVVGYEILYRSFFKYGVPPSRRLETNYKASKYLLDNPEKFMKKVNPKSKAAFERAPAPLFILPQVDLTGYYIPTGRPREEEQPARVVRKKKKTTKKKSSPANVNVARVKRKR